MTIDEAIEGLKNIHQELSTPGREKDWLALLLGIEALERLKDGRTRGYDFFGHYLPGETEEVK